MKNVTKTEKLQKNLLVDKNRIKHNIISLEHKANNVENLDVSTSENNIELKDEQFTKNFQRFNVL